MTRVGFSRANVRVAAITRRPNFPFSPFLRGEGGRRPDEGHSAIRYSLFTSN